ncbi:tRNA-splicing endonuclease subunit Sen54 [Hyperolius riggenbachi]|uniref:tRNA-splicing endonuclease subunit Sen54 n=1 Tax=Hyperolius riggenbachi TaxID=752182 RepID=UPI0035A2EF5C
MLSTADIFAVRDRAQTLPQRSHGQKNFLPDGSKDQDAKLQICRTEQWKLLREERIERLGNLGRGEWKPKEDLVELTLPAGKFWQTMGFSEDGRQYLLPEEAVYLLECGSIQLYYKNLPLSVQEAHENLFSNGSFTLTHYQVYSHLKRLGYIVMRYNPSVKQSTYEKWLNLDSSTVPSRKRKRNLSPCFRSKLQARKDRGKEDTNLGNDNTSSSCGIDILSSSISMQCAQNILKRSQQAKEEKESCFLNTSLKSQRKNPQAVAQTDSAKVKCLGSFRWDFSKICFPNCAPDQLCLELPDPEPALLPENVSAHSVDISNWLGKLNLCRKKMSRKEQEQWDWEQKYKVSINADPKVKQCTNWKEYKKLLNDRACHGVGERCRHLWNSTVQPLLCPRPGISTASVLDEIAVMTQCTLLDDGSRIQKTENPPQIHFNLYQSNGTSEFKKSKPGKPSTHLVVRSFDEQIPSLLSLKTLSCQSGDEPVVFALVDYGEVAFYSFKDFQLPVDVFP